MGSTHVAQVMDEHAVAILERADSWDALIFIRFTMSMQDQSNIVSYTTL